MNKSDFSIFKYQHGDRMPLSTGGKAFLIIAGLFFLLMVLVKALPVAFVLLAAILIVWLFVLGKGLGLCIGPRYLICGKKIVYFRNITRIDYLPESSLTIKSASGQVLRIEQSHFPTGARKTDKIKKNRDAKLAKASAKVLEKARQLAPDAVITGAVLE